jgi:hypothetical protein
VVFNQGSTVQVFVGPLNVGTMMKDYRYEEKYPILWYYYAVLAIWDIGPILPKKTTETD